MLHICYSEEVQWDLNSVAVYAPVFPWRSQLGSHTDFSLSCISGTQLILTSNLTLTHITQSSIHAMYLAL
jgi:hypothetical protein